MQVLVNPDGTVTRESFSSVVRMQDDAGVWKDVDYTLVKGPDGSYAPKWAPAQVSVGGGGHEVASVDFADGGSARITWPEELPEPTVEGGVATFEVSDSVDLLVALTARVW